MLTTAMEAARRAGRLIAERYPGGRTLTVKGYRDLVTDTDTAAEALILDLIRGRFPDHAILSEEAGGNETGASYTWVVDPLDGTTNFAHHHPFFAVSIGVLKERDPLIGIIHDPLRDETFVALRGAGAKLNGRSIHASGVTDLGNSMVGLDWGHENEARAQVLVYLQRILLRCGTVRASGSAALALAYVASGRLDAYFQMGLKPWDAAAGMLLVTEAGGRCTTLKGDLYRVEFPDCLATNCLIHDALLKTMHREHT